VNLIVNVKSSLGSSATFNLRACSTIFILKLISFAANTAGQKCDLESFCDIATLQTAGATEQEEG
jgi:hypothetical protein